MKLNQSTIDRLHLTHSAGDRLHDDRVAGLGVEGIRVEWRDAQCIRLNSRYKCLSRFCGDHPHPGGDHPRVCVPRPPSKDEPLTNRDDFREFVGNRDGYV